ncbi:hypothetical protein B296_00007460 [Ensete ventricosum]|uniref:Uncharacterized protein n=1 Tax=Ensete ventricosum TaxID=4639 RepID=A0A426ZWE5_ENSVE|nr:hypothetical protein B296_00007460 [Ensete ventricosum]
MKDNSCQIFTIGDQYYVDCPLHFSIECQSKAGVMRTYLVVTTKSGRMIEQIVWRKDFKKKKKLQSLRGDAR